MGAKDLYLFQIVQYSSTDSERKPSQCKFFVHYCDKAGNPTGEGETHSFELTQNGPKYTQQRSQFVTPRFRGACTLGLVYKKTLYKILDELEASNLGVRKSSASKKLFANVGKSGAAGVEATLELASLPRLWVADRLEALRRAGMVLLGPSLDEMMRKAYQSWIMHGEHMKQAGLQTTSPAITTQTGEIIDLRWGGTGSADLIKRYYCYPYVHYATS